MRRAEAISQGQELTRHDSKDVKDVDPLAILGKVWSRISMSGATKNREASLRVTMHSNRPGERHLGKT